MKYRALPNSDIEPPHGEHLTADEVAPVEEPAKENFGVGAERKRFKGVAALPIHRPVTMQRNAVRCR
jgi:hypothetical protein